MSEQQQCQECFERNSFKEALESAIERLEEFKGGGNHQKYSLSEIISDLKEALVGDREMADIDPTIQQQRIDRAD